MTNGDGHEIANAGTAVRRIAQGLEYALIGLLNSTKSLRQQAFDPITSFNSRTLAVPSLSTASARRDEIGARPGRPSVGP